ncbi:hypothetical protein [Dactylosporangium sp. CA-139066]|uniref:hypothetical protein n=1 Tax=Dactylosporangium sp. CA-139066 TaxID=3239930 RepID=UPI003D92C3F6
MTSLVPSTSTRAALAEACQRYAEALPGSVAEEYLTTERGITREVQASFSLGYVAEPVVGHEDYRGRIAIPYVTASGVVSMRFRVVGAGEPKMLSLAGEVGRIYNPRALERPEPFICICEGESDTWTTAVAGLPAIGIPGAQAWEPFFARALRWYQRVFVLRDSDESPRYRCGTCKGALFKTPECPTCHKPAKRAPSAGEQFAETIAKTVRNTAVVPMPEGHDVNSFYRAHGPDALRERIGL